MSRAPLPVLFIQRPNHRSRQRDTVLACPPEIEAHTTLSVSTHDEFAVFRRSVSRSGRIRSALLRLLVPINVRQLPRRFRATDMLVYTWGFIPLGSLSHGAVIECDTPYVLSLYGITWFRLSRPILRLLLSATRCRGIVCISEACRTALQAELGPAVAAKAHVVYPVPPEASIESTRRSAGAPLRLLFVSTQFILKGGRELLEAARDLVAEGHAIELTLVTDVATASTFVRDSDAFVRLVPASMPRETLRREYFATSHVLVHPTMQDSFGMVLLEALASGLPIVATDLFAADEMVQHGKNGALVEPPVRYYGKDKRAVWRWWGIDVEKKVATMSFPAFATAIADAIRPLFDEDRRQSMSAASLQLFDTRFAADVRARSFLRAVVAPTADAQ